MKCTNLPPHHPQPLKLDPLNPIANIIGLPVVMSVQKRKLRHRFENSLDWLFYRTAAQTQRHAADVE